jgi:hypothetical protein
VFARKATPTGGFLTGALHAWLDQEASPDKTTRGGRYFPSPWGVGVDGAQLWLRQPPKRDGANPARARGGREPGARDGVMEPGSSKSSGRAAREGRATPDGGASKRDESRSGASVGSDGDCLSI